MNTSIENLYSTFSKYPLKRVIKGCPCCELESKEKGLHSLELSKLGWEELGLFTFKAMTTFGDVEDFKHFLPRIFELYTQGIYEAPYYVGVLFSKLEYAKWHEWPENEKDIINQAITTWLNELENNGDMEVLQEVKEEMEKYEFKFNA